MQSTRKLKGRAVSGSVVVMIAEADAAAGEAGAPVAASRASAATGSSAGNGADGGAVGPAMAASAEEAVALLGTILIDTALLDTALLDTTLLDTALLDTALSLELERSMESHAVTAQRGRWVTHTSCSMCESQSSSRPKRGAMMVATVAAGSAVVEALSAVG